MLKIIDQKQKENMGELLLETLSISSERLSLPYTLHKRYFV